MKIYTLPVCGIIVLSACALPENSRQASASCERISISDNRSMFVCDEFTKKLDTATVAAATVTHPLVTKAESNRNVRTVAQEFNIPASEITGITPATKNVKNPPTRVNIIRLDGKKFAVYNRGDATIYIERED